MPEYKLPIEPDKYYHIFNKGINGCDIFTEETNYEYFIQLYKKHIEPIAETYAWVLMGNHFHFLVKVKSVEELENNLKNYKEITALGRDRVNQQFSNLFNAYTKAFNKKYKRTGSLFQKGFHRKSVDSKSYLIQTLLYIHYNPINHGFVKKIEDYQWTSYHGYFKEQEIELNKLEVLNWFDDIENFKYMHLKKSNDLAFEK